MRRNHRYSGDNVTAISVRRPRRLLSTGAVLAVLALGTAACGTSSSGSSSTSSSAGSTSAAGANVSAAKALIAKYSVVPTFTAPGPSFSAASAKGKKVEMISLTDQVAYNVYIEQAITQALQAAGVQTSTFTNNGGVSEWTQGMQTAISSKADAIALIGINPAQISPQITAAQNAGIKVVVGRYTDVHQPLPSPWQNLARQPSQTTLDGELEAASAIINRGGKAHILAIESSDTPDSTTMMTGVKEFLSKNCPACTLSIVDVPVSQWATQGQSTVQSALTSHPDTNFMIPSFDAMVPTFVSAAVTSAGMQGSMEIATADGSPSVLKMLEQHDMVVTDVGEGYEWVGWHYADQILRLLTGNKQAPAASEIAPLRVFTAANIAETGTPPTVSQGYGHAYQTGFSSLWQLSGS